VDAAGNVYVADLNNHRIRKITPARTVTTLAGSSSGFADGVGTAARFNNPLGVAVDAAGNLYVGDRFNHRIRKITPAGVVTTLAGTGTTGSADGVGTAARFNNPFGVAVDAAGNLYVADAFNHRIRKIN
jgi:DNA-binding beta-propeller fold protein YncE